jgi:hypothetical protein
LTARVGPKAPPLNPLIPSSDKVITISSFEFILIDVPGQIAIHEIGNP